MINSSNLSLFQVVEIILYFTAGICPTRVFFRDAYEIVGKSVGSCAQTGKDLSEMSLEELQKFSKNIEQDVFAVLTLEGSVAARNHIGGTVPVQVKAAVECAKVSLAVRA